MLYRVLLYLTRPSDEQLRRRSKWWLLKAKIWLYRHLLRRLLRSYLHYAISDTVLLQSGKIKVVHEYRDLEFESELRRNKIVFKADTSVQSLPLAKPKSRSTGCFGYFKFKSQLSIYVGGKGLFVTHNDSYAIDGALLSKVEASVREDYIMRSTIEASSTTFKTPIRRENRESEESPTPQPIPTKRPQRRPKPVKRSGGMFERDRDVVPVTPRPYPEPEEVVVEPEPQPETIAKRGFEIDKSF